VPTYIRDIGFCEAYDLTKLALVGKTRSVFNGWKGLAMWILDSIDTSAISTISLGVNTGGSNFRVYFTNHFPNDQGWDWMYHWVSVYVGHGETGYRATFRYDNLKKAQYLAVKPRPGTSPVCKGSATGRWKTGVSNDLTKGTSRWEDSSGEPLWTWEKGFNWDAENNRLTDAPDNIPDEGWRDPS